MTETSNSQGKNQAHYKLVCNKDPQLIGIESPDGSWNMKRFKDHVRKCQACRDFAEVILAAMVEQLTDKGDSPG